MQVQRFRVYTDCPDHTTPLATDLSILPVDRMMAERSAVTELPPSQRTGANASREHPNTWLLLWLWWAAKRAGVTAATFSEWSATVLDFDRLDRDDQPVAQGTPDDQVEAPELDPTNGAGATT